MMRVVTAGQMRAVDRHAIDVIGLPSLVLMENAGAQVVMAMEDALEDMEGLSVLVLCGKGNNGGDGLVVLRKLVARGIDARALVLAREDELTEDTARQLAIARAMELDVAECGEEDWEDVAAGIEQYDLVVDAILGTGLSGPLSPRLARVVEDLNASDVPVVAVDVPSGLSGDAADVAGPAVEASLTVTFQLPKICHVFAPAHERCGELIVADIGIPEASIDHAGSRLVLVDEADVAATLQRVAERPEGSHKGTWGHVVVVGGATGRTGAPALSGLAALTSGAGLVTVATPSPCVASVAAHAPELMQLPLPATASGEVEASGMPVAEILERASVLVVGPGLGTGPGAASLVTELLERAEVPVVLDADALALAARERRLLARRSDRPLVLTPHPGEFRALAVRADVAALTQHARVPEVVALAERDGSVIVLKGFRTLVAAAGRDVHVITTGNPGMATAGSGDVLAGLVGSLIGQGLSPWDAAVAGAHVHGLAGDLAERVRGQMSLRATDVIRWLPEALRTLLPDAFAGDEEE